MTSKEELEQLFFKVSLNDSFKNAFFKKLAETNNPHPWFKELDERNLLYPFTNELYFGSLNYLDNYADHINRETDATYIEYLLHFINRHILNPEIKDEKIKKYWIDYMIIKIVFKLPLEYITKEHVKFVEYALTVNEYNVLISSELEQKIIPKIIEFKNKNILLDISNVILKYKILTEYGLKNIISIVDDYWFSQILIKNRSGIVELGQSDVIKMVEQIITEIIEKQPNSFNLAVLPAIEDSNQTMLPEQYQCQIIYLLRDSILSLDKEDVKLLINKYLYQKHHIYHRIAFYIINKKYECLSSLFWDIDYNPIENYYHEHEVYDLFEKNCLNFSEEQIDKIIFWIKNKPDIFIEHYKNDKERAELALAYENRKWLTSCLSGNNKKILGLYRQYTEINPSEIDHPGWPIWNSGVVSIGPPEGKKYNFKDYTNEEIVTYLNSQNTTETFPWYHSEFLVGFKSEVALNFERYIHNPNDFINLNIEYQCEIYSTILEYVKKDDLIELNEILKYTNLLMHSELFLRPNKKIQINTVKRYIAEFSDRIMRDEKYDISSNNLDIFENILLDLLENTESDLPEMKDEINAVLNSTLGAIFSSIIVYSLKYAKTIKTENVKWPEAVKRKFSSLLNQLEGNTEFQVTLGKFLPNLYYLDKVWVENNLDKIFIEKDKAWLTTFSSYLYHANYFHKELYFVLSKKGYYVNILGEQIEKQIIKDKSIQQSCISYLNNFENIEDGGLLNSILTLDDPDYISTIILFIWRSRKSIEGSLKDRAMILWSKLYDILLKHKNDEDYRFSISHLSYWITLTEIINDDVLKWMMLSTVKLKEGEEIFLIESLLTHVENSPYEVGIIYLNMLKEGVVPKYKQENIIKLVDKLFSKGQIQQARDICEVYLQHGYYFLRLVYSKYIET